MDVNFSNAPLLIQQTSLSKILSDEMDDMVILIFQYLDTKQKFSIANVCKKWEILSNKNCLWNKEFMLLPEEIKNESMIHYRDEVRKIFQIKESIVALQSTIGVNTKGVNGIFLNKSYVLTVADCLYRNGKGPNKIIFQKENVLNIKPKSLHMPKDYQINARIEFGIVKINEDSNVSENKNCFPFFSPTALLAEDLLNKTIIIFHYPMRFGHEKEPIKLVETVSKIIQVGEDAFCYHSTRLQAGSTGGAIFLMNVNKEYTFVGLHFGEENDSNICPFRPNMCIGLRYNEKKADFIFKRLMA